MPIPCQTDTKSCQSVGFLNQIKGIIVSLLSAVLISGFLITSCQNISEDHHLKPYFFPMDSLKSGQVYVYESTDSLAPKYIRYRAVSNDTLLIERYNQRMKPEQIAYWNIVSNGARLHELFLYHEDSIQRERVRATIERADVFPFRVRDSLDVILFKVHWEDPLEEGRSYTVIKNRRFDDTLEFLYNGKPIPAVRMNVMEAIDDHQEGTLEIQLKGWEVYAEGLGLVAWQKTYRDRVIQSYRLADRISPEKIETE